MKVPLAAYNSIFGSLFEDGRMIGEVMRNSSKSGGLSWIFAEAATGTIPPPKYWTSKELSRIFAYGMINAYLLNTLSKIHRIPFSNCSYIKFHANSISKKHLIGGKVEQCDIYKLCKSVEVHHMRRFG